MKSVSKVIQTWFEVGLDCSNRTMYTKQKEMYDLVRDYITEDMHDEGGDGYWNESFGSSSDFEGDLDQIHFYYDETSDVDREVLQRIFKHFDISSRDDISGLIKFTTYSTPPETNLNIVPKQ